MGDDFDTDYFKYYIVRLDHLSSRIGTWPTFLQARESVRYAISTILRVFLMDQAVAAAVVQQRGVEVIFAFHPED